MRWLARLTQWLDRRSRPAPAEPAPVDDVDVVARAARGVVAEPEIDKAVETPTRSSAVWSPAPPTVRRARDVARAPSQRAIRLALQGGGAHGAFTWGVLDRLLEDESLVFPILSGTSAGAMNGAMLVSGFEASGRAGARAALRQFWERVAEMGAWVAPLQASTPRLVTDLGLPDPASITALWRYWSPTQLNPFNLNPLRDLLAELVDVDAMQRSTKMRLHVAATRVETGEPRIFAGKDLTIDALMASSCLPAVFHAVTIDDEAYWDGGYSANPALGPLLDDIDDDTGRELLLVQINPERRVGAPTTAATIRDRIDEIMFNASLLTEWRAATTRAASTGLQLHRIALHDEVADMQAATGASLDRAFHRRLMEAGRAAAERWLTEGAVATAAPTAAAIP